MRRWAPIVAFGLALLVVGTVVVLRQQQASALGTATLTVLQGTVSLQRPGGNPAPGNSGDSLLGGEQVRTGPQTKAAVSYLDGSLTRLDSDTSLTLRSATRVRGGVAVDLYQDTGKTWHRVKQLSAAASYRVSAPNSTTAEVRGTEFDVVVIRSADGQTSVRVDCWAGSLDVSSGAKKVALGPGDSVTSTAAGLGNPVPITPAIRQDPWTVYNLALDNVSGTVVGIYSGHLSSGQSTDVRPGGAGDGQTGLQFTLAWPGSTFRLEIDDPTGARYDSISSSTPPVTIQVTGAQAGAWSFQIHDLESTPEELWVLVVSRLPAPGPGGAAGGGGPLGGVSSSSPSGSATAKPSPSPTTSPSGSPSGSPSASPSGAPTSSPSASPPPPPPPSPAAPVITSAALGTTKVGQPYSKQMVAHGGTLPYRWGLSGAPAWLSIDPNTGVLSGTPKPIGSYTFTVTVTDANNLTGSRAFTLSVIA